MLGLYEHLERELDDGRASSIRRRSGRRWCRTCARRSAGRSFSDQEVRTFRGVVTALSKGRGRVLAKLGRSRRPRAGRRRMSLPRPAGRPADPDHPGADGRAPRSTRWPLAVSQAGGLGILAAAGVAPDEIEAGGRARSAAARDAPFGGEPADGAAPAAPAPAEVDAALARLAPWYAELGVPLPARPNHFAQDFEAQLAAVIARRAAGGLLHLRHPDARPRWRPCRRPGPMWSARPPRSPRRAPGPTSAPTGSAPRASRPAATAATSWPRSRPAWSGPWRWSPPSARPSTCR